MLFLIGARGLRAGGVTVGLAVQFVCSPHPSPSCSAPAVRSEALKPKTQLVAQLHPPPSHRGCHPPRPQRSPHRTCAWPPLQTRRRHTQPHWPSRSCWAASSAEGAATRKRYPGEGPAGRAPRGRGRAGGWYPAQLPGLPGGRAASSPSHPDSFGECPSRREPPEATAQQRHLPLAGVRSGGGAACDGWVGRRFPPRVPEQKLLRLEETAVSVI